MMRLLGFMTGFAAVAGVVALLLTGDVLHGARDPQPVPQARPAPAWGAQGPAGTRLAVSAGEETRPVKNDPDPGDVPAEQEQSVAEPETLQPVPAAPAQPVASPPDTAQRPALPETPRQQDADGQAAPADSEQDGAAAIWAPFRSERAARGFAEHLAERYRVASSVRREGAGRYVVILEARDEALEDQLDRLRTAGLDIRSRAP